uniref:Ly6/PLAUR domain-containing protein 6 n=1 Tax=Esox lucius TaxID=8010 RepID=A0AAY5K4N1_ESOLU
MMAHWPKVAWVLLLTVIADWLEAAQSRDFTVKDIIFLHPSTTPHPGGFKCFTCKDAPDNYECNRWAPDVYCPRDSRYCYTFHMMDTLGGSVSVTKRCVTLDDCQSIGCTDASHEGYKESVPTSWQQPTLLYQSGTPVPILKVPMFILGLIIGTPHELTAEFVHIS